MSKRVLLVCVTFLLVVGIAAPSLTLGQNEETILTIALPDWIAESFTPELFADFEAGHPGAKVIIVKSGDNAYFSPAAYALEEHLDGAEKYARSGDVLYVSGYTLSAEAVRAGYFLDLAPLVAVDSTLNESDFFPAIWQSYQWDGGIWALPVSASLTLLIYNVEAFDAAGLAYPDPGWTLEELIYAADTLTQKNEQGTTTLPGFVAYDFGALARSLLDQGFYDNSVIPNPPDFDRPEIVALLERWSTWQQEGGDPYNGGRFEMSDVPITVDDLARLYAFGPTDENTTWAAALLPGGKAGLRVDGFAVSAGTTHPELAYALANYLTLQPAVINRFFSSAPARQSMVGVKDESSPYFMPEMTPEVQAIRDDALAHALPVSELRFADYLNVALGTMQDPEKMYDAQTALQEVETTALAALQTAETRRSTTTVMVATPVPTPVLTSGQVALKFGLTMQMSPLPNEDQWEQAVADFVSSDPEVEYVELDTSMGGMTDTADVNDCFFSPYNRVSPTGIEKLLNLDPFLDADPDFDPNDVIGNTLAQLSYDDKTWGYPLALQPAVLWYEPDLFTEAGALLPENGWPIEAFVDTLSVLKQTSQDDLPPFVPQTFDNTYILLLTAAFGGIPFDFNTDPVTINLTDPTVVDALRQVLDLAKEGYIDYQELGNFGGGGYGGPGLIPITGETLSLGSWRLQYREQMSPDRTPAQLALYPYGSQFTPASYDIGAAYISAHTLYPEACYRWIRLIAQRPQLFLGMPALRPQIELPELAAAQGDDIVQFYRQYADMLEDPNLIILRYGGSSTGNWIEQVWFNRVLDSYVLEDGDLETGLADAETNITAFRGCTANIPPYDPAAYVTQEEQSAYYDQFIDCAVQIDPSLEALFRPGE